MFSQVTAKCKPTGGPPEDVDHAPWLPRPDGHWNSPSRHPQCTATNAPSTRHSGRKRGRAAGVTSPPGGVLDDLALAARAKGSPRSNYCVFTATDELSGLMIYKHILSLLTRRLLQHELEINPQGRAEWMPRHSQHPGSQRVCDLASKGSRAVGTLGRMSLTSMNWSFMTSFIRYVLQFGLK